MNLVQLQPRLVCYCYYCCWPMKHTFKVRIWPVIAETLLLSNSRLSLKTKSWLCFTPVTRTTRKRTTTPHQNLSVGSILKGWNLTHRLLRACWLSLGGYGSKSQEEQEQQQQKNFSPKFLFRPKIFLDPIFFLDQKFFLDTKIFFRPKIFFRTQIFFPDQNFFFRPKFFPTKIFSDQNFFWTYIFFRSKIFFRPNIIFALIFFSDPKQCFEGENKASEL